MSALLEVRVPAEQSEGTRSQVLKWLKAVGEPVSRDEPLFEVSTDKVDSEVPSPAAGTLAEIRVQEGETVDVGTVAFDSVRAANELGVDVIITDHHEPQEKLPEAFAILNPKLGNYPFSHLCGAGMAFKRPWRARSWDQFAVPRPFQPAACVTPPPLSVPPDADRDTIEACRLEVERRMQQATAEAEAWVEQL